jgi:hypothetical protein
MFGRRFKTLCDAAASELGEPLSELDKVTIRQVALLVLATEAQTEKEFSPDALRLLGEANRALGDLRKRGEGAAGIGA